MKTVKLQPIAMIRPNSKSIYAPSRIQPIKTRAAAVFANYYQATVLVSFEPDGKSNPVERTAYGLGLDCRLLWRNIAADDPTNTDGSRPQRGSS